MSDPRMTGLILMGVSITAFLGTNSGTLPAVTFFPALLLFLIGAFKFMRSNSEALARAEKNAARRVNPTIRENRQAHAHVERLASRRGSALSAVSEAGDDPERAARAASGQLDSGRAGAPIEIEDQDKPFVVTADVSFPVEVQSGDALADQLRKLNQLMVQGILTEEEYAVAKAKLLG